MFGIGMPEMLLIFAIALIVIGPKKLPELAKTLGRAMNEFKRATTELKQTIELEYDVKDVRKTFDDIDREMKKPIDINPMKDKSANIDMPTANAPLPPGQGAQAPMSAASSLYADSKEDDALATDIPAELMPDAYRSMAKKEDIAGPGTTSAQARPPKFAESGGESRGPGVG